MPSTREIRQRIKSVGNISKITNAMQLVAASKMRRAQMRVLQSRDYAEGLATMLNDTAASVESPQDLGLALLERRPVKRSTMLLVTPDRGLAGAMVANVVRKAMSTIEGEEQEGRAIKVVTVGRKGERFTVRSGSELLASFETADAPAPADVIPIASYLAGEYAAGNTDQVVMVYARFINTAVQKPVAQTLLPLSPLGEQPQSPGQEPIYEPRAPRLLAGLLDRYIEVEVYQALLEASASEHSARMVAMKNATDNATELIEDLTLEFNKARQEFITGELLDIVGGSSAMAS